MLLVGERDDALLTAAGAEGEQGRCQTEHGGGDQPAQTQIVQRQTGYDGDVDAVGGEGAKHTGDQRADAGARLTRSGIRGISREMKISTSVGDR